MQQKPGPANKRHGWVTAEWLEARKHLPVKAIAAEIGCSDNHVYALFTRLGVERQSQREHFDWVTAEWLAARVHLTNEQIAAEIGCYPKYVTELLKRCGLLRQRRRRANSRENLACPCGPCGGECMARAMAGLAVRCEVGSGDVDDVGVISAPQRAVRPGQGGSLAQRRRGAEKNGIESLCPPVSAVE